MPTLTMNFEAGTTGEVEFINPFFLFETDGGMEIAAPFRQTEAVVDDQVVVELRSGVDPGVTPNPWSYTVLIRVNGQREYKLYITMPLADVNFVDVAQLEAPATPEYFVLKSDFLDHLEAVGDPASEEDITDAIDAHEAAANPHPVYLTQSEGDALYATAGDLAGLLTEAEADTLYDPLGAADDEETRATAAELALGGRIDDAEDATTAVAADLATEITNRTNDVNAEETRATTAEGTLTTNLATEVSRATAAEGANATAIGAETTRATAAEGANASAISAEAGTRASADSTLTTNLATEVSRATAAEGVNAAAVVTEAGLRSAADATLTTNLATEVSDRITDVNAEETRALAAEGLLAPLASPALTGNPTVPNQTAGNSSTRAANTAFVGTAVANEATARDTAIGVETSRATTAEALLAPKASPTFTGNPLAPTPSVDDNDTSIATTGFVQANSSKIWSSTSTSAPSDSVGQDGDYYIIQDSAGDKNRVMYGPKASGTWTGVAKQLFLPETHGTNEFLRSNTSGDQSLVWQALTTGDMPPIVVCTVDDSAVNVPDTTTTIIGLTATESLDTDGYHSNVTNRSRITVPTNYGGWHMVSARASWASNATGYRRLNILVSGVTRYTLYVIPAASGSAMNFAFTLMVNLSAGDYVQVEAVQTSGSPLACTLSEFTVMRLPQP